MTNNQPTEEQQWKRATWHHPPYRSQQGVINHSGLCVCPDGLHSRRYFSDLGIDLAPIIIADHNARLADQRSSGEQAVWVEYIQGIPTGNSMSNRPDLGTDWRGLYEQARAQVEALTARLAEYEGHPR